MTDYIKIAGVSERDTDLLLLEEFTASPDFVQFFLERIDFFQQIAKLD